MKTITERDWNSLLSYGFMGLTSGVMYQVCTMYLGKYVNMNYLEVPTDVLTSHLELYCLFCELQHYNKINRLCFTKSVTSADRFLFIKKQLESGMNADIKDRPLSYFLYKDCTNNIEYMMDEAKRKNKNKDAAHIHKLYESIMDIMRSQWISILKLTTDI